MIELLAYLYKQGLATQKKICPELDQAALGLPAIDPLKPCLADECNNCEQICPTKAIEVKYEDTDKSKPEVRLDLGACIGCGLCIANCSTGLITRNLSTQNATRNREDLILSSAGTQTKSADKNTNSTKNMFKKSLAIRVVSTGCSACDLEIGAAGNPIFDMERFGIQVVASPRMADALVVTGPVGKGMHKALIQTYEAIPEPRLVIACGTCAISGGVHRGGYAEANGLAALLPVDIFIPGCPPHPWSIINALMMAMGRSPQ